MVVVGPSALLGQDPIDCVGAVALSICVRMMLQIRSDPTTLNAEYSGSSVNKGLNPKL